MKRAIAFGVLAAAISAISASAGSRNDGASKLENFDRTGETVGCISLRRISQIDPISDKEFLVRVGVSEYYLNEVSGRCHGADRAFNRLQYTTSLSQLCRNEIITVVDNSTGFTVGACGLGGFERLEKKKADETKADETAD